MPIVPVSDPGDSRIAEYRSVPDGVLLRGNGLFIAEGRLVVRHLLASRLHTQSLLVTAAARQHLADVVGDDPPYPVYVVAQSVMNGIVGFNIHRGCLALGVRPQPASVGDLIGRPAAPLGDAASVSRVVVLEAVSNVDNVGGIFRSVAALGGHAVVVGPGCGDPLYRKAIRTSIGATLRVPFAPAPAWPEALRELTTAGFTLVALTPGSDAEPLEDVAADLRARARVALLVGAEGDGLSADALACADVRVRIPMAPGVDSINVTTATAIALYRVA
jgi:tRNA G18 (ribose-2'-O)-methylase SpoU